MQLWNTKSARHILLVVVGALAFAALGVLPVQAADKKEDANEERSENRDFLKKAHQAGLAEIEISRLGRDEATNEDVKKFASLMVIDHQKMNKEIEAIAEARRMTLDEKITDSADLRRDRLAKVKGAEFDKQFMSIQVDLHNQAIKLFAEAAKDSKDPRVDQFVKKSLPVLREHHERAQNLLKDVK